MPYTWTKIEEIRKQMQNLKTKTEKILKSKDYSTTTLQELREDFIQGQRPLEDNMTEIKSYNESIPLHIGGENVHEEVHNGIHWRQGSPAYLLSLLLKHLTLLEPPAKREDTLKKANDFLQYLQGYEPSKVPLGEAFLKLHASFPSQYTKKLNDVANQRAGIQWNALRAVMSDIWEVVSDLRVAPNLDLNIESVKLGTDIESLLDLLRCDGQKIFKLDSDHKLIQALWKDLQHDLDMTQNQKQFLSSLHTALEKMLQAQNTSNQSKAVQDLKNVLNQPNARQMLQELTLLWNKKELRKLRRILDENNKDSSLTKRLDQLEHYEKCFTFYKKLQKWQNEHGGLSYETKVYDGKYRLQQEDKKVTPTQKEQIEQAKKLDELLNQFTNQHASRVGPAVIKEDIFKHLTLENLKTLLEFCLVGKHQLCNHEGESKELPQDLVKKLDSLKGKPLTAWLKALPKIFYTNENLGDLDALPQDASNQEAKAALKKVTETVFTDFLWDLNYCLTGNNELYGDVRYFDKRLLPKVSNCLEACSEHVASMQKFIPACVQQAKDEAKRKEKEKELRKRQCMQQAGLNVPKLQKNYPEGQSYEGEFENLCQDILTYIAYYRTEMLAGTRGCVLGGYDALYRATAVAGSSRLFSQGERIGHVILCHVNGQPRLALALEKEKFSELKNQKSSGSDPASKYMIIDISSVILKQATDGSGSQEVYDINQMAKIGKTLKGEDSFTEIVMEKNGMLYFDVVAQTGTQPTLGRLPNVLAVNERGQLAKEALTKLHAEKRKQKYAQWRAQNPNATPQQQQVTWGQISKMRLCTWAEELRCLAECFKQFLDPKAKTPTVAYTVYDTLCELARQALEGNNFIMSSVYANMNQITPAALEEQWNNDPLIKQCNRSMEQLQQVLNGETAQAPKNADSTKNGTQLKSYTPMNAASFQMSQPKDISKIGLNPGQFFVQGEATAAMRIHNFHESVKHCDALVTELIDFFHTAGNSHVDSGYYEKAINGAIKPMLNVQGIDNTPFMRYITCAQKVIQDFNTLYSMQNIQQKLNLLNQKQQQVQTQSNELAQQMRQLFRQMSPQVHPQKAQSLPQKDQQITLEMCQKQQLNERLFKEYLLIEQQKQQIQQQLLAAQQKLRNDFREYREQYVKCQEFLQKCMNYAVTWDRNRQESLKMFVRFPYAPHNQYYVPGGAVSRYPGCRYGR